MTTTAAGPSHETAPTRDELVRRNLQRSFSQDGEDRLLLRLMKHRRNGFYVDVGAYHPFRFSNTALFHEIGWRGINIDATPGVMDLFEAHRPEDINLHYAVARQSGEIQFKLFAEGAYNTALTQREIPSTQQLGVVTVPCDTINNILEKHLPPDTSIGFMNVDVEGLDVEVVSTLDFARFAPEFFIVEDHGFDLARPEASAMFRLLTDRGYRLRVRTLFSCIYETDKGAAPSPALIRRRKIDAAMSLIDSCVWCDQEPERLRAKYARAAQARKRMLQHVQTGKLRVACGALRNMALDADAAIRTEICTLEDLLNGADADVVILSSHHFTQDKEFTAALTQLRARLPAIVTAVYMRDCHHMYEANLAMAASVDFVAPGHFYKSHYLRAENFNILNPVPMAAGQFLPEQARTWFEAWGAGERSSALYGGYGYYSRFPYRSEFIGQLGREIPGSKVTEWRPEVPNSYFAFSREEAFRDWLAHKVSIVVNTDFCIPQRIFDALAAGQIPIVPKGLPGFDRVIPPEFQRSLPIVFYDEMTVASAEAAYQHALELFDRGGDSGTVFRHKYAVEHHFMQHRYAQILRDMIHLSRTVF